MVVPPQARKDADPPMPIADELYSEMLRLDDPTVDAAIMAALPTAGLKKRQALARDLVSRGNLDGQVSVLSQWPNLDDELRESLVAQAPKLASALRKLCSLRQNVLTGIALEIIDRAGSMELSYLVTEQLRRGDPPTRDRAGAILVNLARRAAELDHPQGIAPTSQADSPTDHQLHALIETVQQAIVQYANHDHPSVVQAWLLIWPLGTPLADQAIALPEQAVHTPLAQRLAYPQEPEDYAALIPSLATKTTVSPALHGLARAVRGHQLAQVLQSWPHLKQPAVRMGLRRVNRPQTLIPDARQIKAMPVNARLGLPLFLAQLPLDPAELTVHLSTFAEDDAPGVRLSALRELIRLATPPSAAAPVLAPVMPGAEPARIESTHIMLRHDPAAVDALPRYLNDADASVAKLALRALIRLRPKQLPRLLAQAVNSEHDAVRQLATGYLAPMSYDKLWQNWWKLSQRHRLEMGRAQIKIDPAFHAQLAESIALGSSHDQFKALDMIATLNQGSFFTAALQKLARHQNPAMIASAIKALGTAPASQAKDALESALRHPDTRVRANAIEAVAQSHHDGFSQQVRAMADREENRPRANAIKALIEHGSPDGLPALQLMIDDPDPRHRISALWVVRSLGLTPMTTLTAEMAVSDPDRDVRKAAQSTAQHLIETIRPQEAVA